VTTAAGRRVATLAGVAVLAVAVALLIAHSHHRRTDLPQGAGPWNTALAAPYAPARTACGVVVTATTAGVGHPVLPCGVRVYIRYGNRTVLTTVIDHGDVPPGRELNLTPRLAALLGVSGTRTVQWRFTR
jgi:hypothetical protein